MAKTSPAAASGSRLAGSRDLWAGALVGVVTVLAYLPSLAGDFIWNDNDYVTQPQLRSLEGLGEIWTRLGATEQYYPLLHSFFWVQHQLWGDHPLGYHIVTLLLHAGAAVLFALVLRRLFDGGAAGPAVLPKAPGSGPPLAGPGRRRYAGAEWLAALIFALHPVHVESVAWITEQKNTLSIIFYLTAALWYLEYDGTRRPRTYYAALGMFVLSLLCKTVTASLPAALLVAFWWQRGRLDWRRDFRPLLPWLGIGAATGIFTSWVEKHYLGAQGGDFALPFVDRGLVAGRAIWFYLGNLVWPVDLNFIYPRWKPDAAVWWQWLYPAGALALGAALWALRRRSRAPLAAYLFFVGSLFPVLGFVNLYGALYSFVWDHWQYLPDLGPIALAATGLVLGWERIGVRLRGAGPALVAALAVLLGALTWDHCGMFRDNLILYHATLARNPGAWMAHFNLGGIYSKTPGREAEAIAEFETVLQFNPDLVDAHYNLATTFSKLPGRMPEALAEFEAALRINPGIAAIHYNYANALAKLPGRLPDAIAEFEAALRINPDLAEAHYNLGLALLLDPRRLPEAIPHFEAALRTRPDLKFAREIVDRWRAASAGGTTLPAPAR
jgi:tetratricopeptide (TPR) repeat protein